MNFHNKLLFQYTSTVRLIRGIFKILYHQLVYYSPDLLLEVLMAVVNQHSVCERGRGREREKWRERGRDSYGIYGHVLIHMYKCCTHFRLVSDSSSQSV